QAHDVRVRQARGRARFGVEAPRGVRVGARARDQELERDAAPELDLLGLDHAAERAGGQRTDEAVALGAPRRKRGSDLPHQTELALNGGRSVVGEVLEQLLAMREILALAEDV